jgi:hypothetical protein
MGIDLKAYPQWEAWVKIQEGRNRLAHRGLEATLEHTFLAVACATQLVKFLNSEIESKAQLDRSMPDVLRVLTADTTSDLDDLEKVHTAIIQYLELSPSHTLRP